MTITSLFKKSMLEWNQLVWQQWSLSTPTGWTPGPPPTTSAPWTGWWGTITSLVLFLTLLSTLPLTLATRSKWKYKKSYDFWILVLDQVVSVSVRSSHRELSLARLDWSDAWRWDCLCVWRSSAQLLPCVLHWPRDTAEQTNDDTLDKLCQDWVSPLR